VKQKLKIRQKEEFIFKKKKGGSRKFSRHFLFFSIHFSIYPSIQSTYKNKKKSIK